MELDALLRALQATGFATAIRENESLFPWIESLHVLAITLVVGSIAIVDLRLIGVASLDRAAARLTSDVLPCTWAAFALAAITGSLLFSSNAFNYAHNTYFQAKFVFLALAGLNMAVFHLGVGRAGELGPDAERARNSARTKRASAGQEAPPCRRLSWSGSADTAALSPR